MVKKGRFKGMLEAGASTWLPTVTALKARILAFDKAMNA
jgi:hypothetical protein